ncbi:hypothetical protein [Cellulosilyticum sp. I15G10I2]|uniref:hypothetical protein n=1 Tax=Cellulosilyticum sp. I15G10I2 TaxID=1892843 RepID=UPI001495A38C|nr:hypothetical protein [Cellulosilyticum sp. I15G10I2]
MVSKARHYRVVSRNKNDSEKPILSINESNLLLLSSLALIIWIFGIIIGCVLSHNK